MRVTSPLGVQSFGLTDRGLVRKNNEDQFLIATLTKAVRIQRSSLLAATTRRGEGSYFCDRRRLWGSTRWGTGQCDRC